MVFEQVFRHGLRVARLSLETSIYLNLSVQEQKQLFTAALYHDIGKILINPQILNKKERLTVNEFEKIKEHSKYGARVLSKFGFEQDITKLVLAHHERADGNGYPQGMKMNEIPLMARIISVCDAYDVMVSYRPYKKAKSHSETIKELLRCSGSQFDPLIVELFLQIQRKGA